MRVNRDKHLVEQTTEYVIMEGFICCLLETSLRQKLYHKNFLCATRTNPLDDPMARCAMMEDLAVP